MQGNFQKGRSYHLMALILTFQNYRKTQACKCLVYLLKASALRNVLTLFKCHYVVHASIFQEIP